MRAAFERVSKSDGQNFGPAHPRHSRPFPETTHPVFSLQKQAGNQAVQRLLHKGAAEGKLAIGSPVSPQEREANLVADRVMRMSGSNAGERAFGRVPGLERKCSCGGTCDKCREKDHGHEEPNVQMKADGAAHATGLKAPPIVHQVLSSPGQPLGAAERAFMEPRFGRDFSGVRIHTGSDAANSAEQIHARAYTAGSHIVFASNQFAPATTEGKNLLAHELTHIAQQRESQQPGAIIQRAPWGQCPDGSRIPALDPFLYGAAEAHAISKYRGTFGHHCVLTNKDLAEGTYPKCSDDEQTLVHTIIRDFHHGKTVRRRPVVLPGDVTHRPEEEKIHGGSQNVPATQQPDILDVTDREVYDVTTRGQRSIKSDKIHSDYLPVLEAITNRNWSAGTTLPAFRPLTFPFPGKIQICFGATDFESWPGVIQYEAIRDPDQKPDEKKPKEKESGPPNTLPEQLLKFGGELALLLLADGLLSVGLNLAAAMGAVVASPLVALAALVLGIVYFWDKLKLLGRKIAALAQWVWGKFMWVVGKIKELGIKLGELASWLGDKITWLVGRVVAGVEWAAGKAVKGAKWIGREIASAAEAAWDWLFGSSPQPTAPTVDLPVTEDTEHCAMAAHEDAIVKIGADLLFPFNEWKLKPEADSPLKEAARRILAMLRHSDEKIIIKGFTDNVGSEKYNQDLSDQRAGAVRDWFVQQGVAPISIIETRGFGKTQAQYNDPAGRAKDRRVEIWVTKHGSVQKVCW